MAARTNSQVLLRRALDRRGRYLRPSASTIEAFCPECGAKVAAIYGSTFFANHFRHVGAECGQAAARRSRTGAAGMSREHAAAQDAVIDHFAAFDPRVEQHSTGKVRRADVMVTYRGQNIVIEIQRSNMSISDMEARTRDWNADGAAVLWVFTKSLLGIDQHGNAQLRSPASKWTSLRGWGQCYLMDAAGTLWWIDTRSSRSRHVARPLIKGMLSAARGQKSTLVVDRNTSGGGHPLLVAAFGWKQPGPPQPSLLDPTLRVPRWAPFHTDTTVNDTTPDMI